MLALDKHDYHPQSISNFVGNIFIEFVIKIGICLEDFFFFFFFFVGETIFSFFVIFSQLNGNFFKYFILIVWFF